MTDADFSEIWDCENAVEKLNSLTLAQWAKAQLENDFSKVTACSADELRLRIKLYIFYLPLYESVRRESGVFTFSADDLDSCNVKIV